MAEIWRLGLHSMCAPDHKDIGDNANNAIEAVDHDDDGYNIWIVNIIQTNFPHNLATYEDRGNLKNSIE